MEREPAFLAQLNRSLHSTGRRMTRQRALVLQILEEHTGHLDAESIWQLARQRDKALNLATVYRSLSVLREMGLIDQRFFVRQHKREIYESTQKPSHYHFTCLGCGRVFEFRTGTIERLRLEIERQMNWRMTHSHLSFEGYCSKCRARNSAEQEEDE